MLEVHGFRDGLNQVGIGQENGGDMPIERIGQFLESDFSNQYVSPALGIESNQLEACVDEINRRNIKGVFGCPAFNFREDSFDFMNELQGIEQVWFWEVKIKEIQGLYRQGGLRYFGVSPKRPRIDFSRFPELGYVHWQPVRGDTGIGTLSKLSTLDVWRYKPSTKELSGLDLPGNLRKLDLNWCNMESLRGAPEMPNLVELQIHYCRNLTSIEGLPDIAPNLRKLIVTRNAKVEGFEEIKSMDLDHVYVNVRGKEILKYRHREVIVN